MNEQILNDGIEETSEKIAEVFENQVMEEQTQNQENNFLSEQDFKERFNELFDLAGNLFNIPELKIDHEKHFEVAGADATAAKLYECAQKYKIMRFLIEPSGGWLGDAILIGGFVYGKANVISQKFYGLTLAGRIKSFFKRSTETVKKVNVFNKFFKKGE